ncbi:MAG: response regulator [Lentisphaeraceae bacterium]|nr:response regulator [Lentisphaeraceae bacterium]
MTRILLVDDDVSLLEVLQEGLINYNFDVMTAYSGNEAMNILNAGTFDLLITDMYMTDGGGQQLVEWCGQNKPKLKILGISGECLDHTITALDLVGDKGHPTMIKPFKITELVDVIKGILNNQFF